MDNCCIREYLVRNTLEIDKMEEGFVDQYPWGGTYRPITRFRAGWGEDSIRVWMECMEQNPLRRVTQPNGRVWCDSCMEFFFAPGNEAKDGYFNFEMNANGALLLGYGTSNKDYVFSDFPRERISLIPKIENDKWSLELTVPFDLIRYHVASFEPSHGLVVHGNFYKCGDETLQPHFGTYFPIDTKIVPQPCFHVPAFYGKLVLE